jgi:2-iminoacetate synthase ThiH
MGHVPQSGGFGHAGRSALMTRQDALELFRSNDLIELGMRAHGKRQSLHPAQIVTYSIIDRSQNPSGKGAAVRVLFDPQNPSLDQLEELEDAEAIVPACVPGTTATEYLKFLAVCRLYRNGGHIQLDADWSGLKVAQVALRFGANDFGDTKPGSATAEEEIRRVIRDAGFVPKKRDLRYRLVDIN